jgi:hypothetical protein
MGILSKVLEHKNQKNLSLELKQLILSYLEEKLAKDL